MSYQNKFEEAKSKLGKSTFKVIEKAKGNQVGPDGEVEEVAINENLYGKPLYTLHGNRGRHMFVYEDYVIIKTVTSVGSVITGNATDGEKVIFYTDCLGIQTKNPGLTIGYMQFETGSNQMNNLKSGWFNENTFTYDEYSESIEEVHKYIFNRLKEIKTGK